MAHEVQGKEQLRLLRTPFGLEQRAAYVQLDRLHEELDEYLLLPSAFAPVLVAAGGSSHGHRLAAAGETGAAEAGETATTEAAAPTAAGAEAETAVSTVLIVGDQNAGKTSFLFCFSRHLFLQQLQLSSFLPLLRASFVNARLIFISSQQLLRMQQAAATTQQQRAAAAAVEKATVGTRSAAAAATAPAEEAAAATRGGVKNAAAVCEAAGEVAAAAAADARLAAAARSTLGSYEIYAAAGHGDAGAAEGNGSSSRRTEGEDSSEGGERRTSEIAEDVLLHITRDELPFLDSDVARALVLFTLEDFLFFCDEFDVPISCCSRDGNKISSILETCSSSSSCSHGSKTQKASAAACPASLQAAGIRYVAVHLLEFGGDHLDRLLRFFQLTSRGQLSCGSSSNSNTSSSAGRRPTTGSCIDDNSSSSRESSGGRHICRSRVSSSGGSCNARDAHMFGSCPGGTGVSNTRSCTCCASELLHGRTAMGRGSAAERAVVIEAAKQILKEEQQRFQQVLIAKAEQEQLTAAAEPGAALASACAAATAATPPCLVPPASPSSYAVPAASAAGAPDAAKFAFAAAAASEPAAAPASSCAEEASPHRRPTERVLLREAVAAAGHQEGTAAVGHTRTPTAAAPAAKGTPDPQAQSIVLHATPATRGEESDVEEGDGDMPPPSGAAEALHRLPRNAVSTPAADPGDSGEDAAEEQSRQSLQLLQVLRRSVQLLSEATHTLYFVNCSSLTPPSRRCTRPCCAVSAVRTPERCFALDPTAFAAFVGRLYTLALVQQRSVCRSSGGRDTHDSNVENKSSRTRCVSSSSSSGSGSSQCHSCNSAAELPFRERQPISFVCCRLPEPQAHFSSASDGCPIDPDGAAPGAGAAAAAAEADGGELSAEQLLERCCSCCVRENFNTAVTLLRTPHTGQQQQQRYSPPHPAKQQQRFSDAEEVVPAEAATSAAEAGTAASAPRAPERRTANAGPAAATKEASASSHIPEPANMERETRAAQPVLPGAGTGGAAVPTDEDRQLSAEEEDPGGCHHSVGEAAAVNHELEASAFRLFMQLFQEAAAAAVAAATSAGAREAEEELIAAAAEETALRNSPRFLFLHALLHFMWAWHAAAESDAGATQSAARDAAVVGLAPAGGAAAAAAAESTEEAAAEAAAAFLNDDSRAADAAGADVSAQLLPERNVPAGASAARGEAAGRRAATGEAAGGVAGAAVGGPPSMGASAAADGQVDVGDPAERMRHTESGRQQADDRRRAALTRAKTQLQLPRHHRGREAAERFPPRLQQPRAHCSSQMTVICSTLQLQAVLPVQLLQQPQKQLEPHQAAVQRVSQQQQQLEAVEVGQLLPPWQQQMEEGQGPEQRGQDMWAQQQEKSERGLEQAEQGEGPVLNDKEQQQREWEHADELEEEQEEHALLQPPFRVGAVVKLFATLLRLGCMAQQKEPSLSSSRSFPAEASTEDERTALGGASAALAAGVHAALSPAAGEGEKGSHGAGFFFDEHQRMATDAGSPCQLAARTAAAAAAAEEAGKEKGDRAAVKCTAGAKAVVAPTGELGRRLLLTFLQLARKQRQFVRLSTDFAQDAGEAEAAGGQQRVQAAGAPLVPGTAVLDIWFSSLDAVLLLNDEDEDGCCSGEAHTMAEQRGGYRSSRSSRTAEATGAAAAKSLPSAGSSSETPLPAAEAAARPAQASAAPAADAAAASAEARDVSPRTAADAQQVCASFERLHMQLEQTAIAEEASFLPASTFLQLLPTLLAGLVEIGAASPYEASAAPFPPVLLELRWVQEPPPASTAAAAPPTAAASSLTPFSAPSFLAPAPREAAEKLPGSADCRVLRRFAAAAAEEPERCRFPPATSPHPAPAARAAGAEETQAEGAVASAAAAKAKEELQAPETVASRVMKTAYGQLTTSLSTMSTSAPKGDGFDGTTDAAPSSAAHRPAAGETQSPQTCTATPADYCTTPRTVAAPPGAALSSPDGRNVSPHSAAAIPSGQCIKLLLAPAGLLQQEHSIDHSKSGAAPAATSVQQRDGSKAAVGEKEERTAAVKGGTASSAARGSGGGGVSCGGAAAAKEKVATGGPPVRMALQEQLFNFVYYSLQEAAWAGPLPAGFWRRETCLCWESCNSDAESVCCSRNNGNRRTGSSTTSDLMNRNSLCTHTSLGTSRTSRGSSSSTSRSCGRTTAGQTCGYDVAAETPWLDCVEQCVLQALHAQVQVLCTGLYRYSECVAKTICSCSSDGGAAARPVATAGDSQCLPEKTPAGVSGVAVVQPPQLRHADVQLEQQGEKQEANAWRQQNGGRSRQVDQALPSSRPGPRHSENPSLHWKPEGNLAAAEAVTQTASVTTEIAAAAHVLLQLAGDMALLARMKSCAPHGEAALCCSDGCSGEEKGTLKGGDITAEANPPAGSTAVPSAGQTVSDVKAHMSEPTSKQAATAVGAEATQALNAAAGAAGGTPIGGGAVGTSVRPRLMNSWRGLAEETRVTSGSAATRSVHWWVEDQTCSPGNVPYKKIVVEVLVGRWSSVLGNSSFGSSDPGENTFPVCGSSASHDVCTPQKQVNVLATLAHLLRCPRNSQHQQQQERKQHSQQRRSQQRIDYLSTSREEMTRGSSPCGEEEEAVAEYEARDPSEVFYLRGDNLCASLDAAAAAARTETLSCWRKLLCQLEDENISLSFF